jgi:Conserved TM helix
MWQFLNEVVQRTLTGFGERLAAFGPNLLAMLVLLMAGLVVAWLAREVLRFLLPRLGFDAFAERFGLADGLRRGGLSGRPSRVLASMSAWAVLAVFVILAIGALNCCPRPSPISRRCSSRSPCWRWAPSSAASCGAACSSRP